ncbi:hypothetical protein F4780DRAFT_780506 [Xylariomycetidae sp. FL0641]|nr:hypothetical protein F4780DRAFT_780506 [Xylariomycetidae sp. FL0641]
MKNTTAFLSLLFASSGVFAAPRPPIPSTGTKEANVSAASLPFSDSSDSNLLNELEDGDVEAIVAIIVDSDESTTTSASTTTSTSTSTTTSTTISTTTDASTTSTATETSTITSTSISFSTVTSTVTSDYDYYSTSDYGYYSTTDYDDYYPSSTSSEEYYATPTDSSSSSSGEHHLDRRDDDAAPRPLTASTSTTDSGRAEIFEALSAAEEAAVQAAVLTALDVALDAAYYGPSDDYYDYSSSTTDSSSGSSGEHHLDRRDDDDDAAPRPLTASTSTTDTGRAEIFADALAAAEEAAVQAAVLTALDVALDAAYYGPSDDYYHYGSPGHDYYHHYSSSSSTTDSSSSSSSGSEQPQHDRRGVANILLPTDTIMIANSADGVLAAEGQVFAVRGGDGARHDSFATFAVPAAATARGATCAWGAAARAVGRGAATDDVRDGNELRVFSAALGGGRAALDRVAFADNPGPLLGKLRYDAASAQYRVVGARKTFPCPATGMVVRLVPGDGPQTNVMRQDFAGAAVDLSTVNGLFMKVLQ